MGAVKGAPITRESRPAGTGRPSECQLGGDRIDDSSTVLRVQLLTGKIGLTFDRACLVAAMAWEGAQV